MSLIVYAHNITIDNVEVYRKVRFYGDWPGFSPTVNASWFIAKAYLANLEFTQRNCKPSLEVCNEVFELYKHSIHNETISELMFPVLL